MRVMKFMVDRDWAKTNQGCLKVGTQWQRGWGEAENEMPEKRVDQYSWNWDTEPKSNLPYPVRAFDAVILRESADKKYRIAFEIDAPSAELNTDGTVKGTFSIGAASTIYAPGGVAPTATVAVVPTYGPGNKKAGVLEIDGTAIIDSKDGNGPYGWFYLMYTPTGGDIIPLYKIGLKADKDLMGWNLGSQIVGGPYNRKGGKWVQAE